MMLFTHIGEMEMREEKGKRAIDLHEVGDYLISSYESTSPDLAGAIAGLFLKSEGLVLAKQEPTGSAGSSDASLGFDLALVVYLAFCDRQKGFSW